jgi:hypothetical protein
VKSTAKNQEIVLKQKSIVKENNGMYWISEVERVTIQSIGDKA